MKKALAGPAKRTAKKKKPERRAMIAAVRRRVGTARRRASWSLRRLPRRALVASRRLDRAVDARMRRAWPRIAQLGGRLRSEAKRWAGRAWKRLRPVAVACFRGLGRLERVLLGIRDRSIRLATRASAVLTPERAICATIAAAGLCLVAAQFVDYRAVEVGQPGYAGLSGAEPPTVAARTAGEAHAYILVPVGLLAAALALAVALKPGRRGLGRIVFGLGLLSVAVILLVDLPAGLDAGIEASRFSGATAVLEDGFYAQLAAAAGLMLGGALLGRAHKPRPAARALKRRSRRKAKGARMAQLDAG